jgi:LysM repeat protein
MKRAIHVFYTMVLLVSLFGVTGGPVLAADPVVKISPSTTQLDVGQTATVYVEVSGISNLFAIEVHMSFDPNVVEVIDADASTAGVQIGHGDFLKVEFVAQNTADNTAGKIDYAVTQMGSEPGKDGSGKVAVITFKGKAAGSTNVTINQVLASDPGASAITVTSSNGVVQVGDGPTPEPTSSPTPEPTSSPTASPTASKTSPPPSGCTPVLGYHYVKAGETLYSIGRAYATLPSKIASCNGIVNPSRIYVGTKLAIPTAPWSPVPPGPIAARQFTPGGGTPVPTPSPSCKAYHKVVYGETLTLIAWRYGTTIWAIARANSIYNINLIYAGQTLCIPN